MSQIAITPHMTKSQLELAERVKTVLKKELKVSGIQTRRIATEPLPGTKLIRVTVISPNFASLRPSERQDLIWRILSSSLTHEQQLCISMVVALTPKELIGL